MIDLVDLSGKRILVVGASSGIGRATAVLLSQLEATVILSARREVLLQETLDMLAGGGSINIM